MYQRPFAYPPPGGVQVEEVSGMVLSWLVPTHRPTDSDVEEGQDEDVASLGATSAVAPPYDMPHRSSAEVIDSGQWERLGPTRQPPDPG
jgi:hypothetical protein